MVYQHYHAERESQFPEFMKEIVLPFWERVETGKFINKRGNAIASMRVTAPEHNKAIMLVTGRAEFYSRYQELVYDLFHHGYDVYSYDHIGQGLSDKLLDDSQRGHIDKFSDYVDDLDDYFSAVRVIKPYQKFYAIAHSMGGGILAKLLLRKPESVDAAVFCAPMFGINMLLPNNIADSILNFAERYPNVRDYYAIGTGKWRALPFAINLMTQSKARYEYNVDFINANPELKVGGPTYHWVKESMEACERIQANAQYWSVKSLIFQAEKEFLVSNKDQDRFVEAAGLKPEFINIPSAKHELLFETDETRIVVLDKIFNFLSLN